MLDRASTFADPEVVRLVKSRCIPVALDQAYQRRQKDAEGDFYRQIVSQSPRQDFDKTDGTTQGLYVAAADGTMLGFSNHRDPRRIEEMLASALKDFKPSPTRPIEASQLDPRFHPELPDGGLVLRVRAKILDGYAPSTDRWEKLLQSATSRDNMWLTAREHRELCHGTISKEVQLRLARFHCVDNTRGEPLMWDADEVRSVDIRCEPTPSTADTRQLNGKLHLESADARRGYIATLRGEFAHKGEKITRLDVVIRGEYWGEGPYTKNAPPGKFPLAITLERADQSDPADTIPPQGSRGWIDGYW